MNHIPHTITALIEVSVNRYLDLDPDARNGLQEISGKALKIIIREFNLPVYFQISSTQVNVFAVYQDEVDTTMSASILALAKLAFARDGGESVIGGDIEMTGNMEVGRQFRNILKNVDIDWEEVLSKYTGDIVAHQVGNSIRAVNNWAGNTVNTLGKDLTEYLQEESRELPTPAEVVQFVNSVDELRFKVERTEARIKLLLKSIEKHNANTGGA